jgi:hypothetical protein
MEGSSHGLIEAESGHFCGWTEQNDKKLKIASAPGEIETEHHLNTS